MSDNLILTQDGRAAEAARPNALVLILEFITELG